MQFWKYSALGNTFLVIPTTRLSSSRRLAWVERGCSAEAGLGADGVVLLHPARKRLEIYNADGSRARVSGNGTRCAAAWWFSERKPGCDRITLGTSAGAVPCRRRGRRVEIELPPPRFEAGRIPARARTAELWNHPIRLGAELGTPQIFALNVGNAQCVVWVRRFERNWRSLGAAIERHSLFPDRTNVAFARRAPEGLEVRLWERGVGETPSSGTGAAAAVVVGARLGRTPRRVVVHMPGGDMKVQWKRSGPLTLSCEVTCIARGMLHARGAP